MAALCLSGVTCSCGGAMVSPANTILVNGSTVSMRCTVCGNRVWMRWNGNRWV